MSERDANHRQRMAIRDNAFKAVSEYLLSRGWVQSESVEAEDFFYYVDPLTGMRHRSDFAFLLQTEREAMEVYGSVGRAVPA